MKVVALKDVRGTEREVHCPNGGFVSYRILLERDRMGFSLHRTEIPVGPPQHWHYKHHREACYCIAGKGILVNLTTGKAYQIEPDVTYVLDAYDNHSFQATEPVVLICTFNPPVTGTEVHDADGSYPASSGWLHG